MSFAVDHSTMIGDIQKVMVFHRHMIEQIQPEGAYGKAIKRMTVMGHAYSMRVTHVDTGATKSAHRMELSRLEGSIFLDPYARRGDGKAPAQYGPYEEARGGGHAFYNRTVREQGDQIGGEGLKILVEGIDRGR